MHYAESHGARISFTHVHSHQGNAVNEFADDMAEAGANFAHCSCRPFRFHEDWYHIANITADWAWMKHLGPYTKTQYGFPQALGSVLPFSICQNAMHACSHKLSQPEQARNTSPKRHLAYANILQHWSCSGSLGNSICKESIHVGRQFWERGIARGRAPRVPV